MVGMACCKCCCGGVDCSEGQEGKCCCGGIYGTCCQVGEYCCSGVCQSTPCEASCCGYAPTNCVLTVVVTDGPGPGTYEWDFATDSWVGSSPQGGLSFDAETCLVTYTEADSPYVGSCNSWSATATAVIVCSECCGDATGVGCSLTDEAFSVTEDTDCTGQVPTNITLSLSCTGESCCGGPCEWQPVWVGGFWSNGWELLSGCNEGCSCPEPSVEDVGTEAYPFQEGPYETSCSQDMGPMQAGGAGTELKGLLKLLGITAKPGCSCNQRAEAMDKRGCDWCEQNIDQIDGWLAEEAKKRKLPYLSLAGKALIRVAIRRARKKGNG